MVKHSPVPHGPILHPRTIWPAAGAGACLLLVFLAQCLWLVGKGARPGTVDLAEIYRLERGTALVEQPGLEIGCGYAGGAA